VTDISHKDFRLAVRLRNHALNELDSNVFMETGVCTLLSFSLMIPLLLVLCTHVKFLISVSVKQYPWGLYRLPNPTVYSHFLSYQRSFKASKCVSLFSLWLLLI